jgi:hypothetical protein
MRRPVFRPAAYAMSREDAAALIEAWRANVR